MIAAQYLIALELVFSKIENSRFKQRSKNIKMAAFLRGSHFFDLILLLKNFKLRIADACIYKLKFTDIKLLIKKPFSFSSVRINIVMP